MCNINSPELAQQTTDYYIRLRLEHDQLLKDNLEKEIQRQRRLKEKERGKELEYLMSNKVQGMFSKKKHALNDQEKKRIEFMIDYNQNNGNSDQVSKKALI